jgi:hypothetical protein
MSHSTGNELVKFTVVMASDAATKEVCSLVSLSIALMICAFGVHNLNSYTSFLSLCVVVEPTGFTCYIKHEVVRVEKHIGQR